MGTDHQWLPVSQDNHTLCVSCWKKVKSSVKNSCQQNRTWIWSSLEMEFIKLQEITDNRTVWYRLCLMTPHGCNQQNPNSGEIMQVPISSTNKMQWKERAEGETWSLKKKKRNNTMFMSLRENWKIWTLDIWWYQAPLINLLMMMWLSF